MSARRPWAWPLVPVYRAALAMKESLRGEPKRLQWPVVSVGSVSTGGAGKTPVVIALAQMLKSRGWDVDVLSRGYGRSGHGVEQVAGLDTVRFGDEPVLISQRAEVPVWVGADRFTAGVKSEASGAATDVTVCSTASWRARWMWCW
jgi:tetraacyldisaccharide 4'-kinase